MIRELIKQILLEDLKGFQQKVEDINYESDFEDPTFEMPEKKKEKELAKKIKRLWSSEADHEFMKSIIKVHWFGGGGWKNKLDKFMNLSGNNEIATMGYLPKSKITSKWGTLGVIVQGKVTLAANSMNAIGSGFFYNLGKDIELKYKSSGIPRRPLAFNSNKLHTKTSSESYILDRQSFKPEKSDFNEFIVDNWKPVAFVLDVDSSLFIDEVNFSALQKIETGNIKFANALMSYNLPIYDSNMDEFGTLLKSALRGEAPKQIEDFSIEDFSF